MEAPKSSKKRWVLINHCEWCKFELEGRNGSVKLTASRCELNDPAANLHNSFRPSLLRGPFTAQVSLLVRSDCCFCVHCGLCREIYLFHGVVLMIFVFSVEAPPLRPHSWPYWPIPAHICFVSDDLLLDHGQDRRKVRFVRYIGRGSLWQVSPLSPPIAPSPEGLEPSHCTCALLYMC